MADATLSRRLAKDTEHLDIDADQIQSAGRRSITPRSFSVRHRRFGTRTGPWTEIIDLLPRPSDARVAAEEFNRTFNDYLAGELDGYRRFINLGIDIVLDIADHHRHGCLTNMEFNFTYVAIFDLIDEVVKQTFAHVDTDGEESIIDPNCVERWASFWNGNGCISERHP